MKRLLTIIATLSVLALVGVGTAGAQVIDPVTADIPFEFTVGNVTLPSGQYTVERFGSTTENVLAIRNKEGKILRVFPIDGAQANKAPQQAELIFHRVGGQYFLHEVFDPVNQIGAELPKPRAERRLEKATAARGGSSYVTVAGSNDGSER